MLHAILVRLAVRLDLRDEQVALLQHLPQLCILSLHQLAFALEDLHDAGQFALQPLEQLFLVFGVLARMVLRFGRLIGAEILTDLVSFKELGDDFGVFLEWTGLGLGRDLVQR